MPRFALACLLLAGCGHSAPERSSPPPDPASDRRAQPERSPGERAADQPSDDSSGENGTATGENGTATGEDGTGEDDALHLEWMRSMGAAFVDQVSVRDDGQLVWVASPERVGGTAHAVTLRLTPREVRAVREAVEGSGFFELPAEPSPSGVEDGVQIVVRVRLGDRTHRVRAEEPVPPGVQRIITQVAALLSTDARREALRRAPEAQPEDYDPSLVE